MINRVGLGIAMHWKWLAKYKLCNSQILLKYVSPPKGTVSPEAR